MKIVVALFLFAAGGCIGAVDDPVPTTNVRQTPPTLAVPSDYRSWPPFLLNIQRTDNGQVRDIYINRTGAAAKPGDAFPEDTVMVMDLFGAQKGPDGAVLQGDDGSMKKGDLLKIFLMGKQPGWDAYADPGMKNGDWLYFAYEPDDTTKTPDSIPGCFSCHLPLGESKDWVQRYDEYFQRRGSDN